MPCVLYLSTMLNTKNISPRKLSAFTALLLSVPISLGIYVLHQGWEVLVGSFIIIYIGSYALIAFTLERFIYRKIKLIYRALENPEVNRPFLEKTSRNIDRLVNLINDLDEISKLERGEQVIDKQNFIIQDLVKEVFESLSIKAEQKNIRYSIKKGCESPLTVFADQEKIRQVIINLVENSIKYGKYGGNITASMYITDGKHVLVEISDDGIGMAERHLSRVFERFYRTEEGRSLDITGSGLGLAICKHIIEAHGQTIHVRSTEHVGTTIGFTLERKKE